MNIYEKLGLQKVINASGRMTILGVSVLSEECAESFKEGSQNFVVIEDLMEKAGEIVSKYTGGEDSCIVSSASAGIAISTASLITKDNVTAAENLHILETKKREIIIQKGHVVNYGAPVKTMIELGGGKLVEVGQSNLSSEENITGNITENTVGLFYVKSHHSVQKGMLSLEKMIEIGKKYNLPVIVDAAAEEDLEKYIRMGADLVIYSGSKALEGAASGFITGKKELIRNCKLQYKGIGRAMKVDKGVIMCLLKALEIYSLRDEKKIDEENRKKAEKLSELLGNINGTETSVVKDEAGRDIYRTELKLQEDASGMIKKLETGNPAIYTRNYYKNQGKIHFDMRSVDEKDLVLIAERIRGFVESQEIIKEEKMLDTKIKFYKGRVALNVLAKDLENAKEIYEATEGHAVVGLLSKNYDKIEDGVKEVQEYLKELGVVSVGLGAGDPSQFQKAALISCETDPGHVNQVFTGAGYAAGALKAKGCERTYINVLVSPTGEVGKVKISTGELSEKESPAIVNVDTAVAMIRDMKAHSVKFFPMGGLKSLEELKEVVRASERGKLELIEPTGGIDLENFEEILKVCIESEIPRIMPHVYGSIIDNETGKTRIEDVKKLYDIVKKLVG